MQYRSFGDPSSRVSAIAFGTGDNAGALVHGSSQLQTAIIARALELGINLFDTSAVYGRQTAETNLGRVLQDHGANDVFIMTKAFLYAQDLENIAGRIRDTIDASLFRLRRERIDYLMLHNPLRSSPHPAIPVIVGVTPQQVIEEVLPAMQEAQSQGKVRFLGLACDDSQPELVRPVLATGAFAVMNLAYNLTNPSAARKTKGIIPYENYDGLLEAARDFNIGVAVVRPLAGGALASSVLNRGLEAINPLSRGYFRDATEIAENAVRAARNFDFLDRQEEQTLAQAAYRFILANQTVSTAVGGFSDPEQLDEIVGALHRPLSDDDVAGIEQVHTLGFA
jgi:aryl-alcohol dehydrogenase-like predicted oxidoreductase